ncbi:MAG: hypothetical protein Q9162_006353 [Coniocarpon cinnabarinum]
MTSRLQNEVKVSDSSPSGEEQLRRRIKGNKTVNVPTSKDELTVANPDLSDVEVRPQTNYDDKDHFERLKDLTVKGESVPLYKDKDTGHNFFTDVLADAMQRHPNEQIVERAYHELPLQMAKLIDEDKAKGFARAVIVSNLKRHHFKGFSGLWFKAESHESEASRSGPAGKRQIKTEGQTFPHYIAWHPGKDQIKLEKVAPAIESSDSSDGGIGGGMLRKVKGAGGSVKSGASSIKSAKSSIGSIASIASLKGITGLMKRKPQSKKSGESSGFSVTRTPGQAEGSGTRQSSEDSEHETSSGGDS